MPPPALTATVTVSPAAPEPECRTELLKISLTSKTATSPHGCPGPSTSETKARAARARSARPPARQASRSPEPPAQPSAHPPSRPPSPWESRAAGRTQRDGRSTRGQTSRPGHPRNGPRNPRQAATHTAPWPRFPSAMRPWTPQHNALQRYKVTHAGTEKKRPASARYRRWWQVLWQVLWQV